MGDCGRKVARIVIAMVVAGLVSACASVELAPESPDPGWRIAAAPPGGEIRLVEPFVKLVDLAKLRVGMTKAEVLAIFPDPYEIRLQRDDELWRYGFAELIFRGDRLRDWFNR